MKHLILTLIITGLFFLKTPVIFAEKSAGASAVITYNKTTNLSPNKLFIQKLAVKKIFEKYNSPLSENIDSFFNTCVLYNLDCYLLPSIAGLESSFGKFIYPGSYNPFGWGGGYIMFNSWDEAINTVGMSLRKNYLDKGANTVEQIGSIYAESPTWAARVNNFIDQFEKNEKELQLYLDENSVKL